MARHRVWPLPSCRALLAFQAGCQCRSGLQSLRDAARIDLGDGRLDGLDPVRRAGVLDVEDPIRGRYRLEVSSPGVDRPLFTAEHFRRFAGSVVKVRLSVPMQGRRNFTGLLQGLNDDQVLLEVEGQDVTVPFDRIEKARVVPAV